ncbi:hypothetical protein [Pontibacter anaerobius]|uniref:Uncharacterized protein n=1 Tax=Pontibacter anaerobius TaxID=2993940 RepID=A0ABT3RBX0_9BACT|nr:hypothetical protein [Pontibacter anaerobius]MCX2739020.1 hypothetical protein [Pontibacter anaerobius]
MRNYLLLFISTILLLFALPRYGSNGNSIPGMEKAVVKKACTYKRLVKRNCVKGCLKHQTHSEQQNTAGVVIDCSQPFYAIVNPLEEQLLHALVLRQDNVQPLTPKPLSPPLEIEPDPPRFS